MTNYKNILKNIGLKEKESKIYLACLELTRATVNEIAKTAAINRVTTYHILERLLEKGIVSFTPSEGVKYFEATDPELVARDHKQKILEFEEIVPDLKRLLGKSAAPKIRYFEGLAGVKALYEDTLTSKTEILSYANSTEIRKLWPKYDEEYVVRRVAKKIYLRGITPDDTDGKSVVANNTRCFREIRLIDKDKYNFPNEVNIYDDKVAISSFNGNGPIGIVIKDKNIANTQRALFQMIWDLHAL